MSSFQIGLHQAHFEALPENAWRAHLPHGAKAWRSWLVTWRM